MQRATQERPESATLPGRRRRGRARCQTDDDIVVVVDGSEREYAGPMSQLQANAFLSCLDRFRPDLAAHAVYARALPEGVDPGPIEAFHIHPAVLDRAA